jgi:hypothetical protein
MPIYLMGCNECGHEEDLYRSVAKMDEDLPVCCGVTMQRKIVAPMIAVDIQPYRSQIDGSMITSRSQHRAHLKQHSCIEIGNETKHLQPKPMTPPPGLKDKLIEVANQKLRNK